MKINDHDKIQKVNFRENAQKNKMTRHTSKFGSAGVKKLISGICPGNIRKETATKTVAKLTGDGILCRALDMVLI
jgi:hypothetical protein